MANKKISQLVGIGTTMDSTDLFVVAEDIGGGNYATVKCEPNKVSEYVLNPISATQISGVNKNVYLDNGSNWDTASTVVTQNPYLQVRATDGKLVTGSGIGNAVGGDNMGDCVATQELYMQGNNITGGHGLYFGDSTTNTYNSRSFIDTQEDLYGNPLTVKAHTDLTLSGNDYVFLKGQSIKLNDGGENTPFSGEVRITGGNLDVDPAFALKVNEIQGVQGSAANDDASISINGASRHVPKEFSVSAGNNYTTINWRDSNVQYGTLNNSSATSFNVDFFNTAASTWDSSLSDGQTLTFYLKNNTSSTLSPTFKLDGAVGDVEWGDQYFPTGPSMYGNQTTVYTFVKIGSKVFGSAITGYAI